jgi:DNA (cytosine-5)-methyltransferase 1
LKLFSCFSGIEAASVALKPLGFKTVGLSEIDPFCCELLKQKFPGITNFGDIKRHGSWRLSTAIDVAVGGPPCVSYSVAGQRQGMADARGNLTLEYLSFLEQAKPRWFILENVYGLLSSNEGKDFGTILWHLAKFGYGFAYKIFDAQHYGVPQRRRRLFIVGYLGDWRRAAAVLFEPKSLQWDTKKRKDQTNKTQSNSQNCLTKSVTGALCADSHPGSYSGQDAYSNRLIPDIKNGVRRLTPVECERLQGFPDNWTRIAYRNKPPEQCPDGPRYKAIGNSFAVPVVRWIGERIKEVDQY